MQTMTLTDFLEARLAEDEVVARGLNEERIAQHGEASRPAPWSLYGIAARTLREVEAKRAILHQYEVEVERGPAGPRSDFVARHGGILDAYLVALGYLASIYADHPDYREKW